MKCPPTAARSSNFDYGLWPGGGPVILISASCVNNLLAMISELEASGHPVLAVANHDVWMRRIIDVQGQSRIARLNCPGASFGSGEIDLDWSFCGHGCLAVPQQLVIGLPDNRLDARK